MFICGISRYFVTLQFRQLSVGNALCRLSLSASVGSCEGLLWICGVCKMPLFQVHSIIKYWCGDGDSFNVKVEESL